MTGFMCLSRKTRRLRSGLLFENFILLALRGIKLHVAGLLRLWKTSNLPFAQRAISGLTLHY